MSRQIGPAGASGGQGEALHRAGVASIGRITDSALGVKCPNGELRGKNYKLWWHQRREFLLAQAASYPVGGERERRNA